MAETKQQFNVNLPSDLVRRVKHHAIDVRLSLSDLIAQVLEQQLSIQERPMPASESAARSRGLHLQPMVHVEDMAASVHFYERLGGEILHGSRDGDWVLMRLADAEIGLLAHPPTQSTTKAALS